MMQNGARPSCWETKTKQLEGALKATEARTAKLKNMRLTPEKKAEIEQLNAMSREYLSVAVVSLTSAHSESSRMMACTLDSMNNALEKISMAPAPATKPIYSLPP
jgi:hypothetical protein